MLVLSVTYLGLGCCFVSVCCDCCWCMVVVVVYLIVLGIGAEHLFLLNCCFAVWFVLIVGYLIVVICGLLGLCVCFAGCVLVAD